MYEIDEAWTEYFSEIEPDKRKNILDGLMTDKGFNESYKNASVLYERRHINKKKPGAVMDKFLFNSIIFISMNRGIRIFKNGQRKDILKMLDEMGRDISNSKLENSIMYWEMRNSAKRYFSTCNSSEYGRKFFGLVKGSDEEKEYQMLIDAWKMSIGVARRFDIEEEMKIWIDAVCDEFEQKFPGGKEKLLNYME